MCKPKKLKRHLPASALETKDRINASPSREGRIKSYASLVPTRERNAQVSQWFRRMPTGAEPAPATAGGSAFRCAARPGGGWREWVR
jgi:hypothetical protein